mgnify:CR=1 FL=1|tara:strand:+ start:1174 stop:1911 length:738 start_codon:yes stop_codon:yes gene_type:complete
MAYVGGKAKGAAHILKILNDPRYNNMDYIEPFVGYGHILRRVENKRTYRAYDANPLLIALLKGIQNVRVKYPKISRREWMDLKYKTGEISFRRAIAAFTYSFNGIEFSSYTTISSCERQENYIKERKGYYDKLRKNTIFMNTKISKKDYKSLKPKNKLIYCDPPYADTTGYSPHFDHIEFWNTIRKWSKNNIVFVSEYKAPRDFRCIAKKEKKMSLSGKGSTKSRWEKVFQWKHTPQKNVRKSQC